MQPKTVPPLVLAALLPLGLAAPWIHASPLVQAFDMRVPVPPLPVTVAGTSQLVYELHLANFAAHALEPVSLEIRDAGTGRALATYSGEELGRRLHVPAATGTPLAVPAGGVAIVYIELALPELPGALDHRLAFRRSGEPATAAVTGAATPVRADEPLVLGPPLRNGYWAAVYHPAWERGHRRFVYAVAGRAVIPGRYAIDWIQLDADGRHAQGDPEIVANWHAYGTEVLAVADAVVAAVRDDVEESETLSAHPDLPLEDGSGNYVVLDLGGNRYAFYEHLKPGSVRVAVGDRVGKGETLAELGFTGHASGPHLHFHVADGVVPLGSEGLPFVIDAFEVLGRYDDVGQLGRAPWLPAEAGAGGRRTAERPAPNVVLRFP